VRKLKHTETGFTLIEVMLVVSILSVVTYLGAPSMISMFADNEVEGAQQSIAQSFRTAKQFARSVNTNVTVTLTLNQTDNTITYTLPDGNNQLPDGTSMNAISLPDQVSVSSDDNSYTFNSLGVIDKIGTITVTSVRDSSKQKTITLLNLLGQIQVD
jgi:prepilin-type N-terminal cleavage/methylation domain-containing protein